MKKIILWLTLASIFVFVLTPVLPARADNDDGRTVRIGFYESGGMFNWNIEEDVKSGYCYEYMRQVAVYTGWNYEYCYGSFADLYDMLKRGEIDILPYTNFSYVRANSVLFSDSELAQEEYYIAVSPEMAGASTDGKILPDGAVISTVINAAFNSSLIRYIQEHELDVRLRYYSTIDSVWDAVRSGEADATIYTSLSYSPESWQCLCTFGGAPTYVAVSKSRPELLEELNEAMSLITQERPAFKGELYEKYFPDNPMRNSLTADEVEWINSHSVLHVGGFIQDAPYIFSYDSDTGKAAGLTVDVINGIIDRLNINASAQFRCYDSLAEMEAALDLGEIDVIIPFYPDNSVAEKHNLILSNMLRISNMELVYKKSTAYADSFQKVATPATRLGIFYVRDNYPDSEIVEADSIQDAVNKVLAGEASGAIAQNIELHNLLSNYDNLSFAVLSEGCGTCFAARPENYMAIRILNRGLNYFSSAEIAAISSQYSYTPKADYSFRSFMKTFSVEIALVLLAIGGIFVITQIFNTRRIKRALAIAESASKAKTDFLFNMSHDIRTPMNAIIGFTTLARKYSDDKERVSEYLGKIDTSGKQMLSLVNQVLEMARIESGQLELSEKPVDLRKELNAMVTIVSEQAKARGLIFNYSFDNITHFNVLIDEARMNSIVLNIIGNSVKFTPEGRSIDFTINEIDSRREGYASYIFTVADTGIGMSREFQKSLFEPFAREKSTTVSRIPGTGLGLSIVKKLIDLMGGTIEVQSATGEGTRFDITIDFRINDEAPDGDETEIRPHALNLKGRRVLLVEDNEMNREIAANLLEFQGIVIDEAEDGDIAVEKVREAFERKEYGYYDLILMDIQMPRMNGYDATRAIRALPTPDGIHIPIVAMTANAFEEDRANALAAGMDEHLAKPIDVPQMLKTLARLMK